MKYSFHHPDSLLKDVEIYTAGKGLNAVIQAPPEASAEQLGAIKTLLDQKGFNVLADEQDGKQVLRLRDIGSAEGLLTALANTKNPAVVGNYTAELTDRDHKEKKSLGQLVKEKQLTVAGLLYLAADTCLIASGVYRSRGRADGNVFNSETVGGILWAIPSVLLIAAGQQNPDVVNGFAMRDMKKKLGDHGIDIPADALRTLESAAAERTQWDRAVQLVYEHAPEINNAMQVWGGIEMSNSGKEQGNLGKQVAGLLVAFGMGLGLILPEKEKHRTHASALGNGELAGGPAATDAQGKENPAIISPLEKKGGLLDQPPQFYAGLFPRFNNVLNFIGAANTMREWHQGKTWLGQDEAKINPYKIGKNEDGSPIKVLSKDHYERERNKFEKIFHDSNDQLTNGNLSGDTLALEKLRNEGYKADYNKAAGDYNTQRINSSASVFNMAASLLYVGANQCYSHTSKENTADIEKVDGVSTIVAAFANIIASHPRAEQAELTSQLSMLLAENKHVNLSLDEASATLTKKAEALNASPWLSQPANNAVAFTRKKEPAETDRSTPDIRITTAHQADGRMLSEPQLALQ